jgi:putative exosortase-associated protein (TIGR04073 family)
MRMSRNLVQKNALIMVCACALLMGTGCITICSSRECREEAQESVSLKGTGREFGRGVTNVAFCWLELPCSVEHGIRRHSRDGPFGIIGSTFGAVFGTVGGTIHTVKRGVGGAVEVALSPFPPYDPLMRPAFPPYLHVAKAPDTEEPCEDESCACEEEEVR